MAGRWVWLQEDNPGAVSEMDTARTPTASPWAPCCDHATALQDPTARAHGDSTQEGSELFPTTARARTTRTSPGCRRSCLRSQSGQSGGHVQPVLVPQCLPLGMWGAEGRGASRPSLSVHGGTPGGRRGSPGRKGGLPKAQSCVATSPAPSLEPGVGGTAPAGPLGWRHATPPGQRLVDKSLRSEPAFSFRDKSCVP